MYPKVEINIENIVENAQKVRSLCEERNIKLLEQIMLHINFRIVLYIMFC